MNSTIPRLSRKMAGCVAAALLLSMLLLVFSATALEGKPAGPRPGPALSTLP